MQSIANEISLLTETMKVFIEKSNKLDESIQHVLPELEIAIEERRALLKTLETKIELAKNELEHHRLEATIEMDKELRKRGYDKAVEILRDVDQVPMDSSEFARLTQIENEFEKKTKDMENEIQQLKNKHQSQINALQKKQRQQI